MRLVNILGALALTPAAWAIPTCNAGAQQAFRAGFPGTLDGSASTGSSPTYFWTQLNTATAPSRATFSSRTSAIVTVDDIARGTYTFQLTVKDGTGSATCTVKDGAVGTDVNDNVIPPDPVAAKVIGPLKRWGTSVWNYFDQVLKLWVDLEGPRLGVDLVDSWNVAAAGTITATSGSNTITGVGTDFKNQFCGGGTTPTGEMLVVWYPYSAYTAPFASGATPYSSGIGRKPITITGCASATSLTISANWDYGTTQSGLNYSRWIVAEQAIWINGSANANYYDSAMAYESANIATGIDDYHNYFLTLSGYWWTHPYIDRGMASDVNHGYFFPRVESLTGLWLRAISDQPTWMDGLRTNAAKHLSTINVQASSSPGIYISDVREEALDNHAVALAALYDTNSSFVTSALAGLRASNDNKWAPRKESDNSWNFITCGGLSSMPQCAGAAGTASVTNNSTTVNLVGGSGWTASVLTANPVFWTTGPNLSTLPTTDDLTFYTATRVTDTQLTLNKTYEGPTATGRHWTLSPTAVGRGTQPFMLGMVSRNWYMAHLAMLKAGDNTYANIFKQYVIDIATWLSTNNLGYDSIKRGFWYLVKWATYCEPPTTHTTECRSPDGDEAIRMLLGEAYGAMAFAYQLSGFNAAIKTAGDEMFSSVFAKNMSDPGYDGGYVANIGPGGFFTGLGVGSNLKWLGFFFGFGATPNWNGIRTGGAAASDIITHRIDIRIADVPNATKVRITPNMPSGAPGTPITCSSMPCAIPVDRMQTLNGKYSIVYEYLSAGDAVLYTSPKTFFKVSS